MNYGEDPPNERDARGRWKRGTSGNKNGRPLKKPKLSQADLFVFGQTLTEVNVNGKPTTMTRRESLTARAYQLAMQGKASALMYLLKRLDEHDVLRANAHRRLVELLDRWVINPRDGEHMPAEVEYELAQLQGALFLDPDYLTHQAEAAEKKRKRKKSNRSD